MLPLDRLTEEARIGFREHGVNVDELELVLELDLDHEGNFGETFLAFNANEKKLYAMSVTSDHETEEKRKKARKAAEDAKAKASNVKKRTKDTKEFFSPDLFANSVFREYW